MTANDETLLEQIDDYINGRMTEGEAAAFAQRINTEPALAELVEMHRLEMEVLEFLVEKKLREKLEALKHVPQPDLPPPATPSWIKWGLGAVLFLLAALSLWPVLKHKPARQNPAVRPKLSPGTPEIPVAGQQRPAQKTQPSPSGEEVAMNLQLTALATSSYVFPEHLGGALRAPGKPGGSPLDEGIAAFSKSKWKTAIQAFRKIPADDDQYPQAKEWLGHAFFKNKQYDEAAKSFQWLLDRHYSEAGDERAEWYLLLSLLPDYAKHRDQVNALLQKILAPENLHSYREDALRLNRTEIIIE